MSGQWSVNEFPSTLESAEKSRHYGARAEYADQSGMGQMNRDKISLFQAIEDAMSQAEKLAAMVTELTQRLEPVRREAEESPMKEDIAINMARPRPEYGSPFAARVTNISDIIKSSQSRVARTMDELDL